jgi:hypothetical protein
VTGGRRELSDNLTAIVEGGVPRRKLFLPLLHAVASQIKKEAIRPFLTNPTKMTAGLAALHASLGTDCLFASCAALIEAEALGAQLDWSSYPPQLVQSDLAPSAIGAMRLEQALRSARVVAAAETCRRLNMTLPCGAAVGAALTGPMRLAKELFGDCARSDRVSRQEYVVADLDASGQVVLAFANRFLEVGASVIVLLEKIVDQDRSPRTIGAWADVMAPMVNLAAFHRVPVVVLLEVPADFVITPELGDVSARCILVSNDRLQANSSSHAFPTAVDTFIEPNDTLRENCCVVLTRAEVPLETDIARLSHWTKRWRSMLDARSLPQTGAER